MILYQHSSAKARICLAAGLRDAPPNDVKTFRKAPAVLPEISGSPFFPPTRRLTSNVRLRSLVSRFSPALWAVLGFVLLLASLSNDSIDMLEAQTWDYAQRASFPAFCHALRIDPNPESQVPLGMFSFWAWARVFGTGEAAMRSLNLLWAALALAALARVGRQLALPWLPALFAIQPFVWYYTDYARTPLMQMAGGALLLAGTLGYIRKDFLESLNILLLCLGAILLSGANIFGLIPLVAVTAGLVTLGVWRKVRLPASGKILLFSTLAILAAFGLFYASTLLRATGGKQLWPVSPANVFFVGYEFLGFQGLDPGRHHLRAIMKGFAPARELLPFAFGLLLLAATYLTVLAAAFKSWLTRDVCPDSPQKEPPGKPFPSTLPHGRPLFLVPAWLMGLGVPLLSAFLLFLLACVAGFPFWGSHLAGAFPFWVLALAITIRWTRQGLWRKAGRLAVRILVLLLLLSSILIRFSPTHKHDDYRTAATEALRISRTGRTVWWVADHSGGVYYGLPLADPAIGKPGEIAFAMNRPAFPSNTPGAIILSRPDNFDTHGAATRLLAKGGYTKVRELQAFTVWEK